MIFDLALALAAALAGAIAAIAGFGIGSLLTPLVALRYGTRLAVAAVSVPHFIGTAFRLASLWRQIDRRVLVRFGILSAAGGLAGAWLHSSVRGAALTLVLAALLIFAGGATLSGLSRRLRFGRRTAWVAGAVSGLFGGLVGNQGGIRAAALLGFDLSLIHI
ncbi:MAG: TSUP family transporter [Candidatus Eisenbacteria bacterium]|nr:TSUP family transporter [Candidatus Eisenbacteria bacterium]